MNIEIMEKFKRDRKLDKCLEIIKTSSEVASDYIKAHSDYKINVNKLIETLDYIPKYIEEIEDIILEMAEEYEHRIHTLNDK